MNEVNKNQIRLRRLLRWFALIVGKLLTRTTVSGLEHIPTEGPVLFAANHLSTYDPVLLITYLPKHVQMVGPGDFRLLWPANWIVENLGLILTDRGAVDRKSLKQMEDVLKEGGLLALFPEGGTWEKALEDVKSGAAYLSVMTHARIVPIALGGTYQVWKKMAQLKRPRISVVFGEPLPPVQLSGDRKTRQQELQDASLDLMKHIYRMLPEADQRFYDEIPRQRFWADLSFMPQVNLPSAVPELSTLTELVSKPNLFSPLYRNAGLPLKPFVQRVGRYTQADEFEQAIRALQAAFQTTFKGYLEYRLGDEKAAKLYTELEALLPIVQVAVEANAAICYTPHMRLED